MAERTLLFCVGATKAGTSWLYATLHRHPDCNVRAVKELHYWDSVEPDQIARQAEVLQRQSDRLAVRMVNAVAAGRDEQAANIERQMIEIARLSAVLTGDRAGHRAYLDWLTGEAGDDGRLIADMTPSYALMTEEQLAEMIGLSDRSKVIYLIRDPLARLWSHARMEAKRRLGPNQNFEDKANTILSRIVVEGRERQVTERGDYARAITRLRRVVPANRLMVEFTERMHAPEGWGDICAFLGISAANSNADWKVHEGDAARMRDDIVPQAVRFLKDQYDWVAAHVAPLPRAWQDNLARASA